MAAGAALMVLSYPLDWSRVHGASGDNPFHYPLTGGVAWLIVVLSGIAALAALRGFEPASRLPAAVYVVSGGLAVLLVTVQLLAGGRTLHTGTTMEVDRGPGMWLALVAALVSCAGAVMTWRASRQPVGG
jgi:NADH:ubiquinone oxidoreductase subunit 6 (subunit J)